MNSLKSYGQNQTEYGDSMKDVSAKVGKSIANIEETKSGIILRVAKGELLVINTTISRQTLLAIRNTINKYLEKDYE